MSDPAVIPIRTLDWVAIAGYLALMVGIGLYFARRNNSTEEYFVGNRSFPGWAIGLSMLGTIISSGTFLALPAAAYVLDWRQLSINLVLPIIAVLAIVVFIPFFRRSGLTSAFEYLGDRYGTGPRLYGTASFIVMQLIRMAQILFLVALPIQFLTGASIETVIIIAGVFVAVYTIVGGIDAVIWTDVIQAIVLIGGGIICFTLIVWDLPGGLSQIIDIGTAHEKFSLGSFDFDFAERTFWTVSILGIVNWLTIYASDQNLVQRYAAAKSMREARKATAIYSAIALPMWAFFFLIGTSLFVYYLQFPDQTITGLEVDQVLPHFILTRVPAGVAGLVVAAIMAAAMSSLDSGVNSISTVVVVDILKPYLRKGRDDRYYLRAARLIGIAVAALMITGAITFSRLPKESMNDVSLIVTSVFGGCVMGLFMLGFFTRRVDGRSATIAIGLAIMFNIYLALCLAGRIAESWRLGVHSYWIGPLVNLVFIIIAYGLSLLRRVPPRSVAGLTVWAPKEVS
ncbi:sodium:solute symporter [Planctomycetales bacterium ZRK34]|nr:sodium:solute symporter [Planctomycetales bacterium ZRK34]